MSVSADRNKKSYLSFLSVVLFGGISLIGLSGCSSDDDNDVVVNPEDYIIK